MVKIYSDKQKVAEALEVTIKERLNEIMEEAFAVLPGDCTSEWAPEQGMKETLAIERLANVYAECLYNSEEAWWESHVPKDA